MAGFPCSTVGLFPQLASPYTGLRANAGKVVRSLNREVSLWEIGKGGKRTVNKVQDRTACIRLGCSPFFPYPPDQLCLSWACDPHVTLSFPKVNVLSHHCSQPPCVPCAFCGDCWFITILRTLEVKDHRLGRLSKCFTIEWMFGADAKYMNYWVQEPLYLLIIGLVRGNEGPLHIWLCVICQALNNMLQFLFLSFQEVRPQTSLCVVTVVLWKLTETINRSP